MKVIYYNNHEHVKVLVADGLVADVSSVNRSTCKIVRTSVAERKR